MCVFPPAVNCWPSESGSGCDVNIEYELQEDSLELNDVVISIPVPSVSPHPTTTTTNRMLRRVATETLSLTVLPVFPHQVWCGRARDRRPGR